MRATFHSIVHIEPNKPDFAPAYLPKSTHKLLKDHAQRQGKKLYRALDEIVLRSLRRQKKNGGKK